MKEVIIGTVVLIIAIVGCIIRKCKKCKDF